jgi:hypothetical protein
MDRIAHHDGIGRQAVFRRCHSSDPRSSLENRVTIVGDKWPRLPGRELFHCNELAFKKGFQIRTVDVDLIWSVPKQH